MLDQIFNDNATVALQKAMDGADLRHRVISDNIANVNTPNFKRAKVTFETELKAAIERRRRPVPLWTTQPNHIPLDKSPDPEDVRPAIFKEYDTSNRNDGNNVDIDIEMAELAKNTIMYEALTNSLSRKFALIKTALRR